MKILISTCLFYYTSSSKKYDKLYKNILNSIDNINYNIDLAIYYDETVPEYIIEDLKQYKNVLLILKTKSKGREGCFWRYEAYDDFDYDIYLFRDIDIGLEKNDQIILDTFIKNNKKIFYTFIVHRRNFYPNQGFLMGGMFGMKKGAIDSFKSLMSSYKTKSAYGTDETFLAKSLYSLSSPMVFIEPRARNVVLSNNFFKTINLPENFEEYVYLKNNYKL